MTLSFPTRRSSDLLGGHVVDGDEDLLERVLDDSGEGAVPTVLLAAEGESPPLQPAGGLQRRVWTTFAHAGGVEIGPIGGVQGHLPEGSASGSRVRGGMGWGWEQHRLRWEERRGGKECVSRGRAR